jgi:hypothetical protein
MRKVLTPKRKEPQLRGRLQRKASGNGIETLEFSPSKNAPVALDTKLLPYTMGVAILYEKVHFKVDFRTPTIYAIIFSSFLGRDGCQKVNGEQAIAHFSMHLTGSVSADARRLGRVA